MVTRSTGQEYRPLPWPELYADIPYGPSLGTEAYSPSRARAGACRAPITTSTASQTGPRSKQDIEVRSLLNRSDRSSTIHHERAH